MSTQKRRWVFSVVDIDRELFLDENGRPVDYSDAKEWIGFDGEAEDEAVRRADLYESNGGLALRIKYHSLGVVQTAAHDL